MARSGVPDYPILLPKDITSSTATTCKGCRHSAKVGHLQNGEILENSISANCFCKPGKDTYGGADPAIKGAGKIVHPSYTPTKLHFVRHLFHATHDYVKNADFQAVAITPHQRAYPSTRRKARARMREEFSQPITMQRRACFCSNVRSVIWIKDLSQS